jgi:hypothetical protein
MSMKNSDTIGNQMKMSKSKSTLSSITQVKNWQKTISTDDKLEVLSQLEKGEQTVNICHNVRFNHSNTRTIRDDADTITEKAKSGTNVFV